jgi:hypothetical protein
MGRPAYGRNQNLVDDERKSLGMDKIFVRPREMADWKFLDTPAVKEHFARPDIAPLLVEEDVWWECQKRLAGNRADRSGRKDRKYPLSGLLLCHRCGRKLVGRISKSGQYRTMADGTKVKRPEIASRSTRQYVCVDKVRFNAKVADRCDSPLWNAGLVESFVYEAVSRALSAPEMLRKVESEYRASQAVKTPMVEDTPQSLKAQVESLERKELIAAESKVEARMNGTSTSPYDVMLARLAQEKRELQKRLDSSQANEVQAKPVSIPLLDSGDRLLSEFLNSGEASDAEKNEILARIIESAIIIPPNTDAAFAGRASGVEIKLKTGTSERFLLQINQLKTKRALKVQFLGSSSERHK